MDPPAPPVGDARDGVWAIVVAAGAGSRFGGPKQYESLEGRRVLDWSLAAAKDAAEGVVLVVAPELVHNHEPGADVVVGGGATRSESVRAGLAAVPPAAEVIVVHDAARPRAAGLLFAAVVDAVRAGADAAVPGVAVADTIKVLGDDGATVEETPDRARLVAVQTPQAFAAAALRNAHAAGGEATDDAALVEAAGGRVVVVEGDPANQKITRPGDLGVGRQAPMLRIGQGFDVHPYAAEGDPRPLVLGGIVFEGERGLAGHSDSDVIAHAVADAVLGAAGLGDIGQHFPDTDPAWKGADSIALLREVVRRAAEAGWAPVNADCSVLLEAPKLAPHREAISARLTDALGAPVSVKAKRGEGLGFVGRREGVACHASVLLHASR